MSAIYIISKIDNNQYCKTNGQFTKHLKNHNMKYQDYYETYILGRKELCLYCSKSKSFYQHTHTYAKTCGDSVCYGKLMHEIKSNFSDEKNIEINKKRSKTNMERYGYDRILDIPLIKTRVKNKRSTIMLDGRTKEEHIQENARLGKLRKYGNIKYNNSDKIQETKSKQSDEFKQEISNKRRRTNLAKFGVENVFLLPGNARKTAKGNTSVKNYKLPSGKIIGIRGSENIVIDKLLESFSENELIIHDAYNNYEFDTFLYIAVNRHLLRYYPDIIVLPEHKIIEVKSWWWWNGNNDEKYVSRLENNCRKRDCTVEKGYQYEVWIVENKKITKVLKNNEDFYREQQKI